MAVRILLAAFCFALTVVAQAAHVQSQAQKEWALGAGALIAQIDGEKRLDLLGGTENTAAVAAARREALVESWRIRSRQDLLDMVATLLQGDSDRMRIGWNYPRAINLARWGFVVGFLQEDDAWSFITLAAERLQKTFSSWQELGQVYLDARAR